MYEVEIYWDDTSGVMFIIECVDDEEAMETSSRWRNSGFCTYISCK
jgi:hypothetical protein